MKNKLNYHFTFLLLITALQGFAQKPIIVDRVVAIVGDQIVKESEVENGVHQYSAEGFKAGDSIRGAVVDQLLYKKLLVARAMHDSITVSESDIDAETDRRMRYFLMQFRSQKEFEAFYGKTTDAFKFELHDQVRDLLLAQRMQGRITADVSVSPSDINQWFNSQPVDSLPFIASQVEIGQIVIIPPQNPEIKAFIRETLVKLREDIMLGKKDFCTAAATESEDPGSSRNCGKYENVRRGTFVPEFDAVCYSLKEGEISMPFETEYGFHIVKLLARRGEEVTMQHILKSIPPAPEDLQKCKIRLDSILKAIRQDSITFCEAAARFSSDAETKFSCGLWVNPQTGTNKIDVEMLGSLDPDPQFPIIVNNMKVGEISVPMQCLSRSGKQAYRILYLKSRSAPHRANLTDDYQLIQDLALQDKQDKAIEKWTNKTLTTTYVRLNEDYRKYSFKYPWLSYAK